MNGTFIGIELKRILRNIPQMFFTAILPAFFYIIFGATQDYADQSIGNGNVAMMVMISMAVYGAVTATTSIGGMAAVERMQGWGRQLGLTPLRDGSYIAMKALVAVTIAAVPIIIIYILGAITGAEGSAMAWIVSALLCLLGAGVFALFGLCIGTAFRSDTAVGAASGSLVILAFLGNVFIPLSGVMLTIAKFTPLYGVASLARYPLGEGGLADGSVEPLWVPLLNVVVWAVIFAVLATYLVRKGRSRQ